MFFYMLVGHALMDYPMQAGPMATEKSRHSTTDLQKEVPWYYWLTAHALLHGGAVALIIQWSGYGIATAIAFGIVETVLHWFIDYAKCEGWTSILIDQVLHVLCKAVFWALLVNGVRFDSWL